MSWFDEQIKQRKQNDNEIFEDSFIEIAGSVLGQKVTSALKDSNRISKDSIEAILKYYHIKPQELPANISDPNEQLEFLLRPHGIMRRNVILQKGWYKDAIGAMLAVRKSDQSVVALIPTGLSGYSYWDSELGKYVKVNHKKEELFEEEAISFYVPFPLKEMGMMDLLKYIVNILSLSDYILFGLLSLAITLLGMLTPVFYNKLVGDVIEAGSMQVLFGISVALICVTISSMIISSAKSLAMSRINTKLDTTVEAATMMRIISLPADFFANYSAGELTQRTVYMNSLCNLLLSGFLETLLSSLFSLVYIVQIFNFAPALVVPSLIIIGITIVFTLVSTFAQMRITKQKMELAGKESGMSYALISGIQKIKLAGAEKRAFARWGKLYAKIANLEYNPPVFLKINSVISTAITLFGTVALYIAAVNSKVGVSDYYSFTIAYGMVSGAFMNLAALGLQFAEIKPTFEIVKPLLKTVPEIAEGKEMISRISGGIELNNVSFRYNENMPLILDNLSMKIRPGQYVAIVGKTGCGKSTLVRLLLGFETPQKGAIYYDGKDMSKIDLKSLRQKIGVVMQNGKLFQGDVFSNISISAPNLTIAEAWEAAKMSGLDEDINNMPMGMFTLISEGNGGISGGQKQRMMIARAIAPKPKLLIMDEATSALDNLTQKKVSESLDALKCTRIVIAHRLSTIRHCDRIIVLDKGKIVEDGTYEELIAQNGYFAELVSRQQLNENPA